MYIAQITLSSGIDDEFILFFLFYFANFRRRHHRDRGALNEDICYFFFHSLNAYLIYV